MLMPVQADKYYENDMRNRNDKLNILVTGGAGFIGSHTTDALIKKGHRVRIMDALVSPNHDGKKPSYLNAKAEFMRGDVRNRSDWMRALRNIDAVYHFAAYMDYLPDFSKFYHVNTVGAALLYEVALEKKLPLKKIVLASSQAVYGEGRYVCSLHGDVFPGQRRLKELKTALWDYRCERCERELMLKKTRETDPLNPHNSYGMSKVAMERMAFNLGRRHGLPTTCMRYSIVQGERQSPKNFYSGALRIFVLQALANLPLTVYEDGRSRRDFVNIHDVVEANLLVLGNRKAEFESYSVGGGRAYTVRDFAERVQAIVNPRIKITVTGEFRFGDTRHIFSDTAKLQRLGWRQHYGIDDSIHAYANWIRKQPSLGLLIAKAAGDMRKKGVLLTSQRH